ncbi:hypothetical protein GCM10010387_10450 [Streptomyces inusitatus]|uniref:Uncharacterized protein n=1 Tax=Streptomyces inusitatus TaxID=68221 RepID=A0A918PQD1_9ACTN|nr:hypothetical protein GCM10010387_10450 [Streptomyces inusitatus]
MTPRAGADWTADPRPERGQAASRPAARCLETSALARPGRTGGAAGVAGGVETARAAAQEASRSRIEGMGGVAGRADAVRTGGRDGSADRRGPWAVRGWDSRSDADMVASRITGPGLVR